MTTIPNQKPVWDKKHAAKEHTNLRGVPSPLAKLAEPKLSRKSKILELGCGVGRDAAYFADHGHHVTSTDVSEVVIEQDKHYSNNPRLEFAVLDVREPFPYANARFDVVYANLSLQYYDLETTRKIIAKIHRVLNRDGRLIFACKSADDMHENQGTNIGDNIYVWKDGTAIHLFTLDYTRELLKDLFKINHLDEVDEVYNRRHSKIIRCIAHKVDGS